MIIALPLRTSLPPQNQQETDWPDAPTIKIPGISSTTSDQPPEVMYNRCQIQLSSVDLEIPELEEDSDQDQYADLDNFITHHNTHQESERIQQEYFTTLQNLSADKYYTEIDRTELQYHTLVSPYDRPTCCQVVPRPSQAGASQQSTEELKQLFGKGRGKARQEELHSHQPFGHKMHSHESRIQWKINVFMNSTPLIANILPLYKHYVCVTPCQVHIKGF